MQRTLPAPRGVPRPDRRTVTWTVLLLAFGVAVAVPFGMREQAPPRTRETGREAAVESIARLEDEQRQLKERLATLRTNQAEIQQRQAGERAALAEVETALKQQRALAGLTRLTGPGATVTLDDSGATAPTGITATDYIIHDTDVRDVVNVLWSSGAEAIAVNGERLVASTSIVCVGTVIIINDTRLSPPFQVTALGQPARLTGAIETAPQLAALRRRVRDRGLLLKATGAEPVALPAYRGTFARQHGGAT